jgi:hypothetical protein
MFRVNEIVEVLVLTRSIRVIVTIVTFMAIVTFRTSPVIEMVLPGKSHRLSPKEPGFM